MAEQQKFIGGVIAATVIERVVGEALKRVAKRPDVAMEQRDVPVVAHEVTKQVKDEIGSRVAHATNTEPAYKSRVTIGSVMAFVGAVVGVYQLYTDGRPDSWETYSPHIGVIFGSLFALYGRWISTKPLGE